MILVSPGTISHRIYLDPFVQYSCACCNNAVCRFGEDRDASLGRHGRRRLVFRRVVRSCRILREQVRAMRRVLKGKRRNAITAMKEKVGGSARVAWGSTKSVSKRATGAISSAVSTVVSKIREDLRPNACPSCGCGVETEQAFCIQCGSRLNCHACGARVVVAGALFCESCGSEIPLAPALESLGARQK